MTAPPDRPTPERPTYVSFTKANRTKDQALEIFRQRIADAAEVHEKFHATFARRDCPVCGASEAVELPPFHGRYGVVRCATCASVYVNPCPSLEALRYYYNECRCNRMFGELLRSRHGTGNAILSDRTRHVIELVRAAHALGRRFRILEIGCSSGAFLAELKAGLHEAGLADCALTGIDIDADAVARRVDPALDLRDVAVEEFAARSAERFDLVLHFELIEHLGDPFEFLRSVRRLLNPGGIQHFHTPNALGFDNVALGYNATRPLAHGIFPPMHLNAFTPRNLTHFALRAGFRVVDIDTPGKFDVDIVRLAIDENPASPFAWVREFSDDQLAVVQHWLGLLGASSHMRCTLEA